MTRLALVGWLLMSVVGVVQKPAVADPFERLAFLIGKWEGTSDGQPGNGTVRREYTRALNTRFVRVHNRSEYPAQPKNPKGEIHEDEGFFSFDKARKRVVFRQFHTEGFVNTYVEDAESFFGARRRRFAAVPSGPSLKLPPLRSRVVARSVSFAPLLERALFALRTSPAEGCPAEARCA
jgi:hypothetical protein